MSQSSRLHPFDIDAIVERVAQDPAAMARATRLFSVNRIRRESLWRGERTSEPFWDILLELFVADVEGRVMNISSLGLDAGIATTTVLRKISEMEAAGLVERRADPDDKRRMLVLMTDVSRRIIHQWVIEAVRSGLTLLISLLHDGPADAAG